MLKRIGVAAVVLLLSGCSANSVHELQASRQYVYSHDGDLVATYRRVLTAMRSCYSGTFLPIGDYFPGRAEILVSNTSAIWANLLEQVIFEEQAPGRLRVTLYRANFVTPLVNADERLESWLNGGTGC